MYIYQLSIAVSDEKNLPEALNEFEFLMASYRGSGQKLDAHTRCYVQDGSIVSMAETQEENSLDAQNNNFYVKLRTERLEELCTNKLQFKLVGKSPEESAVCSCAKSDFYFLLTDHIAIDSPVKCGTCFEVVPLYKLPAYYEHAHTPVLMWEANYRAVDMLHIDGEVGEEWTLEQLCNPNSELSIQGRALCSQIEQNTNVHTYYYLHNAKETTVEAELDSVCPACKQEWLLMKPLAGGIFPFKCDNCRLISAFSSNIVE